MRYKVIFIRTSVRLWQQYYNEREGTPRAKGYKYDILKSVYAVYEERKSSWNEKALRS